MDFLETFGLPILSNKDNLEIEAYENDSNKINIFYSISEKNEKYFYLEIKNEKLKKTNNINKISEVIEHPHENLLKITHICKKDTNSFYLCYEFCDILLSKYIQNANPNLEIRLDLMKQFLKFLTHFHKNKIELDFVDVSYIFIENLENPKLKILHNGKILI